MAITNHPGWGSRSCWCDWCASRRAMNDRQLAPAVMGWQFWWQFVTAHYTPVEVGFSVLVADVGFLRRDP